MNVRLILLYLVFYISSCISHATYTEADINLGIKFLHELGLTGKNVKVAVIDVAPDDSSTSIGLQQAHPESLSNLNLHFENSGINRPYSAHGIFMASRIGRKNISMNGSNAVIAPEAALYYYDFSNLDKFRESSEMVFKSLKSGDLIKIKRTFQEGIQKEEKFFLNEKEIKEKDLDSLPPQSECAIVDYTSVNDKADDEVYNILQNIMQNDIKIIVSATDLQFYGPKTEKILAQFVNPSYGGCVILAIGNTGIKFDKEGIQVGDGPGREAKLKNALSAIGFHNKLNDPSTFLRREGFIFARPLPAGNHNSSLTNAPGNSIPDRTISVYDESSKVPINKDTFIPSPPSSSGASATLGGLIVLLSQSFPHMSPQTIAISLLSTTFGADDFLRPILGAGFMNIKDENSGAYKALKNKSSQ